MIMGTNLISYFLNNFSFDFLEAVWSWFNIFTCQLIQAFCERVLKSNSSNMMLISAENLIFFPDFQMKYVISSVSFINLQF